MKNFEFKSQEATTKEQSQRLLALGLKKETADMGLVYMTHDLAGKEIEPEYLGESIGFWEGCEERQTVLCSRQKQFPAWSLHRLMEIAMKGDKLGCITHNIHQNNVATYYELVISSIEHLIKINEFNKDYLEERIDGKNKDTM